MDKCSVSGVSGYSVITFDLAFTKLKGKTLINNLNAKVTCYAL